MSYKKMILNKIILTLYSVAFLSILHELYIPFIYADSSMDQLSDTGGEPRDQEDVDEQIEDTEKDVPHHKIIRQIVITGNTLVPTNTLLIKIPYRVGEEFNPIKTGQLIHNLWSQNNLKYFNHIEVVQEEISPDEIILHIIVKEKKKLENIIFEGNDNLKQDEIEKKLKLSEIPAIDPEEAQLYTDRIKKLYSEKNYHNVVIETELKSTENNNVILIFKIKEGPKAIVKRVLFNGNCAFSSKKLRSMIFTREDWIFGFTDKAGTYQPEAIEYDKHVIENFYQSNGYLAARVTNVDVNIDPVTQCIVVNFTIDEGDIYTIKCVSAPGNHLVPEQHLLAGIPIKPGQLYSKDLIRQSMEILRMTWGQFGYIYSDIQPAVVPDFEQKTVDITFNSDLGKQVFLNRINIIGNQKTRDYVIRRYVLLNEGELITTQAMDISKTRVEALGYFDPKTGVNWKTNKINENLADLDLIVNEIKTGKLYGQIGYGGADAKSPSSTLRVGFGVSDRNFMGTGVRYNLNLTYSRDDRGLSLNIFQPWLFDKPIGGGLDVYVRRSIYEDFKNVNNIPVENVKGVAGQLTFAPISMPDLATFLNAGIERIAYDNSIVISSDGKSKEERDLFQLLVNRRFESGDLSWVSINVGQDLRNHPIFPSRGYNWNFTNRVGFPTGRSNFGFWKADLDVTWLTPLIGEYDLIFLLHAHFGIARPFPGRSVPYRELYHVGGPATVRGFTFGQIGPQLFNDSVGAQKAFWFNTELIWSIKEDQSMRGVVFYDGGAGWDTPNADLFGRFPRALQNNRFNYRHAVGFGIRLTSPTPLRVDWGFKLDRNKKLGEQISEVHFSMSQDF